jgi:methylmalonyl-CoA/ethylmalonyl-CoA epimerase
MFETLHHVGILADDLDAAVALYERAFGACFTHRERLVSQGVDVALASLPQGGEVELLMPVDPDSSVARYLNRHGPGMHHMAFGVPDLPAALAECGARGIELIDREPRIGVAGLHVAFLHPRSTGRVLIELVETGIERPPDNGNSR